MLRTSMDANLVNQACGFATKPGGPNVTLCGIIKSKFSVQLRSNGGEQAP